MIFNGSFCLTGNISHDLTCFTTTSVFILTEVPICSTYIEHISNEQKWLKSVHISCQNRLQVLEESLDYKYTIAV